MLLAPDGMAAPEAAAVGRWLDCWEIVDGVKLDWLEADEGCDGILMTCNETSILPVALSNLA